MGESEHPTLFANWVVSIFADHLLGRELDAKDYTAIRAVFRRCGGSWSQVGSGNIVHMGVLMKILRAWNNVHPQGEPQGDNA